MPYGMIGGPYRGYEELPEFEERSPILREIRRRRWAEPGQMASMYSPFAGGIPWGASMNMGEGFRGFDGGIQSITQPPVEPVVPPSMPITRPWRERFPHGLPLQPMGGGSRTAAMMGMMR